MPLSNEALYGLSSLQDYIDREYERWRHEDQHREATVEDLEMHLS